MFSIWAKQLDEDNRIIKDEMFNFNQEFNEGLLYAYLQIVCNEWKIETPIVLSKHIIHFAEFNTIKFKKEDFIDKTDFNSLVLELVQQ